MTTEFPGLEFQSEGHIYRYEGRVVPSVTTVLEPYTGLDQADPVALAIAQEFGTFVHDAVDLYNRGELDEAHLLTNSPKVYAHLEGWKKFLRESGAVVLASERKVFHKKLRYAGTLDSVLMFPGRKNHAIADAKTGSSMPKTVGPQTAAYHEALIDMGEADRRMRRYCVHLKDNDYNLIQLKDPYDIDVFRSALTMHRFHNRRDQ